VLKTVKSLIDTLLKQLDILINLVEGCDSLNWYKNTLIELKRKLEKTRKPIIPSRVLWNKYIRLYSSIEETISIVKSQEERIHLYRVLPSIREELLDFISSLKRAYLIERVQLGLPIILCLLVTLLRLFEVFSDFILAGFLFSITALLLLFYSPQIGLIVNSTSGFLIAFKGVSISDVVLGLFLSAVSLTYTLIILLTKSQKFSSRIEELVKSISLSIQLEFKQESQLKTENIMCLMRNYDVDTSGFLKYSDREELVKYKAILALIHGTSTCNNSTTLISDSATSEK